nr:MAG TPA: hypothetical protein [Crassvirales sp.]
MNPQKAAVLDSLYYQEGGFLTLVRISEPHLSSS